MTEEQIVDIWDIFKEYLDKKTISIVAEKYITEVFEYGSSESVIKECMGHDKHLDHAIETLFMDEEDDYEDDEFEDN